MIFIFCCRINNMVQDLKIISVKAEIHPDGDVYVDNGKGHFHLVGKLIRSEDVMIAGIPNLPYLVAKKWIKLGKKLVSKDVK